MPSSYTLSSLVGLAVAGAGLGLYLGHSAISEINPAYFSKSSSGSTFYADLVPNPPSFDDAPPEIEAASSVFGLGNGCIRCPTYAPEQYAAADPLEGFDGSYSTYSTVPVEAVLAEAERYIADAPTRAELERVERYAYYRVSYDEKPAVTAKAELASLDATGGEDMSEEAPEVDTATETETAPAPAV